MANKVSFIIQLKNQFSKNAGKFQRSLKDIKVEVAGTSSALSKLATKSKSTLGGTAKRSAGKFAREMDSITVSTIKAEVNVNRSFKKIGASISRADAKLTAFKKSSGTAFSRLGREAVKTGAIMTAALTLPLALLGRHMIKSASDATEISNKFNEVFISVKGEANAVAKEFAKDFGLANSTAKKMLSSTGDILVGFGFAEDAALVMSKTVATLASDLTSFANFEGGAEAAAEAITKAVIGEAESVKVLGVVVRQGTTEFKKNVKQIMRSQRVNLLQAKSIEIVRIVTEQSQKSIGDVARTWGEYANVQRRTTEKQKELAESFGLLLIPIATKFNIVLQKVIVWLTNLSPRMKKIVVVAAAFVAIGGPLLLLLGSIAGAFALMSFAMLPISAAILGLIAVGALLYLNWGDVVGGLTAIWQNFSDFITGIFGSMGDTFSLLWEGRFLDSLKSALNIGIKLINQFLEPLNFARDIAGLSAIKIPEFKISADDAALKSVSAPSAPSSSMNGQINGQITVAAASGTTIKETKMKSSGSNLNIGMNMMGAM